MSLQKRTLLHVIIILLVSLGLGFFIMPGENQKNLLPFLPKEVTDQKVNLGLDLQGGSQLDYKIDLRSVPAADKSKILEGILGIINRRVNSLGVAEPNIYTSDIGEEKHLIVELAGIKDLEQAKSVVGKTIQLEFKEQRLTPADEKEVAETKKRADDILARTKKGDDFKAVGDEESQANSGKIFFGETKEFQYKDAVPNELSKEIFGQEVGKVSEKLIDLTDKNSLFVDDEGTAKPQSLPAGYYLIKTTEKKETERQIDTPRSVQVRHILLSYKGAPKADAAVTRSEDEAKKLADEITTKLNNGEKFEDLAKQYSDDKGSKDNGGLYTNPVKTGGTDYVKEFQDASLGLTQAGQLSAPTKTVFGYHIIKAEKITEAKSEKKMEPQVKYQTIYISTEPDPWMETGLDGKQFVRADVEFNPQSYRPYVSILFNDEGAKKFEEITSRNIGKPVAIFVGGQLISQPNVNEKISGGRAQISGQFDLKGAQELANNLNTGAIPAPITLVGQYNIGATLGQDALNKSLFAGFIGLLFVAVFMIFFYRLPGLISTVILGIYSTILIFLIKVALPLEWSLVIATAVFLLLIKQILDSKDSAGEKAITTLLSCFVLFFIAYILSTPVVMTLAGIAGVILSIGMAVDANILIFERMKEELRAGHSLSASIEIGFDRAWNSIRDSNFSSLITCAILFYFGSSIIQGFAFNLAAGILVSMFTAIVITKTFLKFISKTKLGENLWLFNGDDKKAHPTFAIMKQRKILYVISGVILVASLIAIPVYGLKAGLDFTGGTLMEVKLKDSTKTQDDIKKALTESTDAVNTIASQEKNTAATTQVTQQNSTQQSTQQEVVANVEPFEKVDLSKSHIVPTDGGYIIKTAHLTNAAHAALLEELKKKIGEFEEVRFSTVGPTVGATMQTRAVFAVILASLMIILYIAFAFRKVPRSVSKWRFGLSAIIALVHDLGIVVGLYVLLGGLFNVEIDTLFITSLLTILGFSVHDTIVVFDRIREKLRYQKRDETFEHVANDAINETLGRSINTSVTVVLTLLALVIFGPETIRFFNISLLIGILSGTYSSIFVATPILVDWQNWVDKKKKK